jgi:hypothetical protein
MEKSQSQIIELTEEQVIGLALKGQDNNLGIEPSNPISEFNSLTEDFMNQGYDRQEAEKLASNIITSS